MSRSNLVLAVYGGLALIALLVGAARGDLDLYREATASTSLKLALSPVLGIAFGLAVVFGSRLAVHRWSWARSLHRDFHGLLGHMPAREIFILAVASAVGEELFFRGALTPWIGIWAQAGVFALLHIGPGRRFLPWTASAFVLGLIFGIAFETMGDLGGPIAAHFTINYLNLSYISRVDLPGPTPAAVN
ncbi:MAG TPA: CPBP family intramembrane glutamic endopeptidase [Kofleriaceae bacterium]|nr:CPBP family intramembrane glutamic endopeptidase [Kofleriaceae bacterium]